MDEELDEIVASRGARAALKAAALKKGYRTMAPMSGLDPKRGSGSRAPAHDLHELAHPARSR